MGVSRQENWSGLPFPTPGDLPHPQIDPMPLASPALAGRFFTISATWEAQRSLPAQSWSLISEGLKNGHFLSHVCRPKILQLCKPLN